MLKFCGKGCISIKPSVIFNKSIRYSATPYSAIREIRCMTTIHSRYTTIPYRYSTTPYSTRPFSTIRKQLFENIYTIPNGLTVTRILMSPIVGYLILTHQYQLGLGLLLVAGFTDALDGYIARNFKGQQSAIGSVLDPAADKILMASLVGSLTFVGGLPVPLAALILLRDLLLALNTSYYRYSTLPPPKTFSRYWNLSLVSAEIKPTLVSKLNTVLQLGLMGMTVLALEMGFLLDPFMTVLQVITAGTTVYSGAEYFIKKGTMNIKN